MMIENYPVGWGVNPSKPEPVSAFLIDLPDIATRGRNLVEAVGKLRVIAPDALAALRREGTILPEPSRHSAFQVATIRFWRGALVDSRGEVVQEAQPEIVVQLIPA